MDVGLLGGRLNEQPAKIYMGEERKGTKLRGKRKTLENGTDNLEVHRHALLFLSEEGKDSGSCRLPDR